MRFLRLISFFAPRFVSSGAKAPHALSRLARAARHGAAIAVVLLFAARSAAQSVRWEPHEDPNGARLIFENCVPDGEPDIPAPAGTTYQLVGQAQSTTMNNFQTTRSIVLTYLVRGPRKFPPFTVKTDKGPLPVAPYSPPQTKDAVASSRFVPERTTVWAGEVFDLTYIFSASRRYNPQPQPTFDWTAAPLVAEEWPKFEFSEPVRNGDPRIEFTYKTRVYAKTPNTLKLEAAAHLLHIQTGTMGFGFLTQARMEPVSVTSDQPVIEVKPLPPAPAGFGHAVGQFKLASRVVPEKAAVGEPVTWTLELSGTGNWPDITALPQREVSGDFHAVQPKPKRTMAEGKLFDATLLEDVVLIPKKAGTYTLGPLTLHYFDPKSGTYKKLTTEAHTITIAAPPASAANAPGPEKNRAAETNAAPSTERAPPTVPEPPAGIPRDPLPGSEVVGAPMTRGALLGWLLAPAPALLLLWLGLAVRRAQKTDPQRVLREGRARLLRTLSALQSAADRAERSALLLAWQREAALLWQIGHAAPHARALPDATWSTLWTEADRALYGGAGSLPTDWIARAQEAAVAKRIPGFQPLRLFLPQNLFPFAAVLAVAFFIAGSTSAIVAAVSSSSGAEPLAAYRAGNFAAAEKTWRLTVASLPTDWIARHNLSLALAQRERPGEAAAQAAAAFVQNPRDPSVRWHFALAAEKGGFVASELAGFLTLGPRHSLARLASPAAWQRALIAATWLATLGLALVLLNSYGARRAWPLFAGLALMLIGVGGAGIAAPAFTAYGLTADERAAVVTRATTLRSIPTEVDTKQKTTPLAPGSTALVKKVFPDRPQDRWVQLEFENGQTGWVRKEDVVSLWK